MTTAPLLLEEREALPAVGIRLERRVMRLGGVRHGWTTTEEVSAMLREHHYLGPLRRGVAWVSDAGCIVVARPTARGVPASWLELSRWCLLGRTKNAGSTQWAQFVRDVRKQYPECTTIVSYSDPSAGHDGALYRACNWWWAPTWHRLRPPPTGNGAWKAGEQQAVKDRWVYALRKDAERPALLVAKDDSVLKRMPWARYTEPGGADYKRWKMSQTHNERANPAGADSSRQSGGAQRSEG